MKKRVWTKKIRYLLVIAGVRAVLFTLSSALRQGAGEGLGTNLVSTVLTPLRSGVSALDRQVERIYDYIFRYEKLAAENESLRQQVARQESAMDTAESYRRENQRLRELLGLEQENDDFSYLSAYVISRDSSVWENKITINKGSTHGLKEGMCAITSTGQVVGHISQCGLNWATISTIYDVSLQLSAQVAASGVSGVVQTLQQSAGEEELQLRYLPANATLVVGDRVVTAGSELFPRGLLLGTVVSSGLDETGISQYARLSTQIDPAKLEQVFIITHYTP